MSEERIINIPNIFSFYRLLAFPFILYFAITGQENLYFILMMINLVTDVLDGLIARAFNMQTDFGARLDSVGDMGTYVLAVIGILTFKAAEFQPHLVSFWIFIVLLAALFVVSVLKFKRLPSLHLYSWKIGGYIQGLFFFVLFVFDFYPVLYYIMVLWGIFSCLEHIGVQLVMKRMESNQKGLYWVLKSRKSIN
jgi:cardiolipin synthase (CMP-forming)